MLEERIEELSRKRAGKWEETKEVQNGGPIGRWSPRIVGPVEEDDAVGCGEGSLADEKFCYFIFGFLFC